MSISLKPPFSFVGTNTSKKGVSFKNTTSSIESSCLEENDVRSLWYNADELSEFRVEIKAITRRYKQLNRDPPRGLEVCSGERRRHRWMTQQCVLSAAKKGIGEAEMAFIARRCSQWSKEVAFIQASRDHAEIYQVDMLHKIPKVSSILHSFPFPMRKRNCDDIIVQGVPPRRIRHRAH